MRRVTLTFDNGPTPGTTDRVLEILARRGLRCSFFVIGHKLRTAGAMSCVRTAHAAGHWIGNHTLTHSIPFGEQPTEAFVTTEIGETEALIGDLASPEKLFRPYGREGRIGPHLFSRAAVQYLLTHRYRTIMWNAVPGDWRDAQGWLRNALTQCAQQDWSVVVLHDIENGCLADLPELLDRLADQGVTFEQAFPPSVVLTDAGQLVNLDPGYVIDGLKLD
jgi:peptidoglycan/xylan/chitin deacetylase (PgdA/CDA1 family)